MSTTTRKTGFREGFLAGLPFIAVGVPFAVLFGVVASEAGLSVVQAVSFSFLVIAGAAQFTAVQLMTEAAPVWIVLATALAVNSRMAMYSASLQPHFRGATWTQRIFIAYLNVDASYALSIQKYEERPEMQLDAKIAFFFGTMVIMAPMWFLGTWVGAVAGDVLPEALELDFAMPILFLALTGPMLKTLAHLGAALTSIIGALAFSFLPSGIGLLVAGVLAMIVGAEIERRQGR